MGRREVSIPQGPINTLPDRSTQQTYLVSIPQGPINTSTANDVEFGTSKFQFRKVQLIRNNDGGTLSKSYAFQFRKVQLIPSGIRRCRENIPVSIPQGPINTYHNNQCTQHHLVSIPQGPINTKAMPIGLNV